MKKVQIISCNTCGRAFAACVEPYFKDDEEWIKSVSDYLKTGLVTVSVVDNERGILDKPQLDCCKKIPHA